MSLIPLMFSNWWEDLEHPHHLPAQHFAVDVNPDRLNVPTMSSPLALSQYLSRPMRAFRNYYQPRSVMMHAEPGLSVVKADKDKFQAALDIQQFAPDEIKVKVVDNYVIVEGKHEEKRDEHGFVMRQFIRKYLIPEQCDIDKVTSNLSTDGILTINAPRKPQPDIEDRERMINIEHTGKPAIVAGTPVIADKEQIMDETEPLEEPIKNRDDK